MRIENVVGDVQVRVTAPIVPCLQILRSAKWRCVDDRFQVVAEGIELVDVLVTSIEHVNIARRVDGDIDRLVRWDCRGRRHEHVYKIASDGVISQDVIRISTGDVKQIGIGYIGEIRIGVNDGIGRPIESTATGPHSFKDRIDRSTNSTRRNRIIPRLNEPVHHVSCGELCVALGS